MSGRIRSIKPEWLEDERMVAASSDARVLSIALILMADDYGNGRCHSASIASRVFPPSGESLESLLSASGESLESLSQSYSRFAGALLELVQIRFCGVYSANGQHYFSIRNWKRHQKVNHPGKPMVPGPLESLWRDSGESLESLLPDLRPTTNDQRPTTGTSCAHARDIHVDEAVVAATAESAVATESSKIPCPKDLALTEAQRSTLETALIPGWAIDVITTSFVASAVADQSDVRHLAHWRKCLSKAISGNWNDSSKRPKKPRPEEAEKKTAASKPGQVWDEAGYWRYTTEQEKSSR